MDQGPVGLTARDEHVRLAREHPPEIQDGSDSRIHLALGRGGQSTEPAAPNAAVRGLPIRSEAMT